MKLFIPTYRRAGVWTTLTTPLMAAFDEVTVVVHDCSDAEAYAETLRGTAAHVVCSSVQAGPRGGKARQMRFIEQELATPGEWYAYADDDIRAIFALGDEWYENERIAIETTDDWRMWQPRFETLPDAVRIRALLADTARRADALGYRLCGFGALRNSMYRNIKWRDCASVDGTLTLWKAGLGGAFDWATKAGDLEQMQHTIAHLMSYGGVVVNNWIHPLHSILIKTGGMGDLREVGGPRHAARLETIEYMMSRYPGLLRRKVRKGQTGGGLDVQLIPRNAAEFAAWKAIQVGQRDMFSSEEAPT